MDEASLKTLCKPKKGQPQRMRPASTDEARAHRIMPVSQEEASILVQGQRHSLKRAPQDETPLTI